MKYNWSSVLTPQEQIIKEFTLGSRYLSLNCIASIGVAVISILIGLLYQPYALLFIIVAFLFIFLGIGFYLIYLPRAEAYVLTNKRIITKHGLFNVNLITVNYDKITDIRVQEYFFQKILYKVGMLIINTAGSDRNEITLINIENPQQLRTEILSLVEKTPHNPS